MNTDSLIAKLKEMGLTTKQAYFGKAFSRNIGLLTPEEQQRLSEATVAIPGLGGVGGIHLMTLVRTGVGRFHLADFDEFDPANANRQFGAQVPDFGRPKLDVMVEQALNVNPYLEISEFPQGINEGNMDAFLSGVDVVIDSIDFFSFDTRRVLHNKAREKGLHVIVAAPLGFSAAMIVFAPGKGLSFDDYFNVREGMSDFDKILSFGLGMTPRPTQLKYMDLSTVDLEAKAGPSLGLACQLCGGLAATEVMRIILKRGEVKSAPYYVQFDPFLRKYRTGRMFLGNRNPVQRIKMKIIKWMLQRKGQKRETKRNADA